MMQTTLGCPGLLFNLVTLITISIAAGLNCTFCTDVSRVKILTNTVSGLKLDENASTPSSPLCKTAVNGDRLSGVDAGLCYQNPNNSSKEYRCVHYNGRVTVLATLDLGTSSGEVKYRYEGTYRGCMLVYVNASGSCVNEDDVLLPEDNELRRITQATVPTGLDSVSVFFQGQKCVSNANGTFLSGNTSAAVKKSCVYILLLLIYFFI